MHTALFKFATWQGNLVIKIPKNITNNSSITSILFSPSRITWGKTARLKIRLKIMESDRPNLIHHNTRETEVSKKTSWDVAISRGAVISIILENPQEKWELWGDQVLKGSDTRLVVMWLKTQWQERIPPRRLEGKNRPACVGMIGKIRQQLWNPLQKRWRCLESKVPSRMEQIPQESVHFWQGREASASKYPRCWNKFL